MILKLKEKKQTVSKIRRKSENELKKARSLQRKTSSGLAKVEKKIEHAKETLSDISGTLTQKLAQKESISRLIASAEDRLNHEKEAKSQAQQEIEFSSNDTEKQYARDRLNEIETKIAELLSEIKSRQKTADRLESEISEIQNSKSKVSTNIQKQVHVKPTLKEDIKSSQKQAEKLAKQLEMTTRKEQSVIHTLDKIQEKLEKLKTTKPKKKAKKSAPKKKAKKSAPKKKAKKSKTSR